jgi:hypothetical protein
MGKPSEKRHIKRQRRKLENNIKVEFSHAVLEGMKKKTP